MVNTLSLKAGGKPRTETTIARNKRRQSRLPRPGAEATGTRHEEKGERTDQQQRMKQESEKQTNK